MKIYIYITSFLSLFIISGCDDPNREKLKDFGFSKHPDIVRFHSFFDSFEFDVKKAGAGGDFYWTSSGFLEERFIFYLSFPIQLEKGASFSASRDYKLGFFDYGVEGLLNGEPTTPKGFAPEHRTVFVTPEEFSRLDSLLSLKDYLAVP